MESVHHTSVERGVTRGLQSRLETRFSLLFLYCTLGWDGAGWGTRFEQCLNLQ